MRNDIVWGSILGCGSILLLSMAYPSQETFLIKSLGGMFWPKILLWGLLILSLLLVADARFTQKKIAEREKEQGIGCFRKPSLFLITCIGYFASLDYFGFICGTLFFIIASMLVLGCRNWKQIALFSVTTVMMFWLIFLRILGVSLPKGFWIFHQLTLFLT